MQIIRCPNQALSADFGDIVIGNVAAAMDFTVSIGGTVVLNESYFPDNNGYIYIRDMAQLAELYRDKRPLSPNYSTALGYISFELLFSEGSQSISRSVQIYICEAETAGTLNVTDLETMPLTRCFRKSVFLNQKEYISFYDDKGDITLDVVYTGETKDQFATFTIDTLIGNSEDIRRIDVSPAVVAGIANIDASMIVNYTVYLSRKSVVKFTMNPYLIPQANFVFFNSFGAWETFTCIGDVEKERKWAREYGQSNRQKLLVNRNMESTHAINSGYITREQTAVLEDLLNARQIAIIDEYGWHPVFISEETFKVKSRRDELINVEFKYRLAGNNHLQYRHNPYRYRIFDFTHNKTFN